MINYLKQGTLKGICIVEIKALENGFFFLIFFFLRGSKWLMMEWWCHAHHHAFAKLILEDVIINFNWLVFLGLGIDKVHMWGQREEGVWLIDACGHGEHGGWFVKEKRRPWI